MKNFFRKSGAVLLAASLAIAGAGNNAPNPEPMLPRKKRLKWITQTQEDINRQYERQGLRKFYFGLNSLYALNQKNADRKAKNLNWI